MLCLVPREKFKEKGASLAAVGLGDQNYARIFREETGIEFPLLVDEERRAYHAVGLRKAEWAVILATGANDEFANAALGVCGAVWSLRSEALIIMIVAADNHV